MRKDPGGVGLYIRAIQHKIHRGPSKAAAKAAANGISFVAIMGAWQQPRKDGVVRVGAPNRTALPDYVDAFHQKGIRVGLWFYPWAGHEEALISVLREQCESAPIDFLCNDAELGMKWKKTRSRGRAATMRGEIQGEAIVAGAPKGGKVWVMNRAKILVEGIKKLIASHGMDWGHWFTAYGMADFHPTLPWEIFAREADVLSPQLYTATPAQVDRGIAQWYAKAGVTPGADPLPWMIPSVPTYGENAGEDLHGHLSTFVDGEEDTDGFVAWSWRQTNRVEWATLARWARWIDRGACALPPAG